MVSNTVDECLQKQIAKKIFQSKIEPQSVNAGHYIAFKYSISLATNLAANFGSNQITITPDIVSKLLLPPSEVAVLSVLFNLKLSRRSFLRQVVNLFLLLCTGLDSEHAVLFQCHIFTQRPMNDRKIERRDGRCFGQQQLLTNSIEIFISQSDLTLPEIYKALNLVDS